MSKEHHEKHVTPPNRNKPSTRDVVKEAQKEYKEQSGEETTPTIQPKKKFPGRVPGAPEPK